MKRYVLKSKTLGLFVDGAVGYRQGLTHAHVFSSAVAAELYRIQRVNFPDDYEICELRGSRLLLPVAGPGVVEQS